MRKETTTPKTIRLKDGDIDNIKTIMNHYGFNDFSSAHLEALRVGADLLLAPERLYILLKEKELDIEKINLLKEENEKIRKDRDISGVEKIASFPFLIKNWENNVWLSNPSGEKALRFLNLSLDEFKLKVIEIKMLIEIGKLELVALDPNERLFKAIRQEVEREEH